MSSLHLAFHYHTPARIDAESQICMPAYLGRFVDSLAAFCASVVCLQHTPLPHELTQMDYALEADNVSLLSLGPHDSIPRRSLRWPKVRKKMFDQLPQLDALLIRGPSPLLPQIADATHQRIPTVLLLVGDYLKGLEDLPQPRWRRQLISLWSHWNKARQQRIAERSLTFVNSHVLFEELRERVPNLIETRTTTLSKADFFERQDTCTSPPHHLLYTGRIDRAKGLRDMVQAVSILVENGQEVVLDLVGWPAKGDSILAEMDDWARSHNVEDRILYHGYKTVGPELFAYYKAADIYLIASQSSEGFPRTIWEAMAHSLPVVATRVGSIPAFVGEAATLVPPENPPELARAVSHLIHQPALRKERIQAGKRLARQNTLENRAKSMVQQIEKWLTQKGIDHGQ